MAGFTFRVLEKFWYEGGRPPCEIIGYGRPINISEFMDFDFYQWIKYRGHPKYPEDSVKLGRWLGIARKIRSAMTYWVSTSKGAIIPKSTVRSLNRDEWLSRDDKDERDAFSKAINAKVGTYMEGEFTVENNQMEEPLFTYDRGPDELDGSDQDNQENTEDSTSKTGLSEGAETYLP